MEDLDLDDEKDLLELKELFIKSANNIDKIIECSKKLEEAKTEEEKESIKEEFELLLMKFGINFIKIGKWGKK